MQNLPPYQIKIYKNENLFHILDLFGDISTGLFYDKEGTIKSTIVDHETVTGYIDGLADGTGKYSFTVGNDSEVYTHLIEHECEMLQQETTFKVNGETVSLMLTFGLDWFFPQSLEGLRTRLPKHLQTQYWILNYTDDEGSKHHIEVYEYSNNLYKLNNEIGVVIATVNNISIVKAMTFDYELTGKTKYICKHYPIGSIIEWNDGVVPVENVEQLKEHLALETQRKLERIEELNKSIREKTTEIEQLLCEITTTQDTIKSL